MDSYERKLLEFARRDFLKPRSGPLATKEAVEGQGINPDLRWRGVNADPRVADGRADWGRREVNRLIMEKFDRVMSDPKATETEKRELMRAMRYLAEEERGIGLEGGWDQDKRPR